MGDPSVEVSVSLTEIINIVADVGAICQEN